MNNLTAQQKSCKAVVASDLTTEEVKERFEWIINFRTTGEYDYDPPASRLQEKRKELRKKTINIKIEE